MHDVNAAVAALVAGSPVVVLGDESRHQDSALVLGGWNARADVVAFVVRHTSGFVCVAISPARARTLELPALGSLAGSSAQPCVSVDAADDIGTGISAADRALTIRLLDAASSTPAVFSRPGHVVPVRASRREGRWNVADAAVELAERGGGHAAAYAALTSVQDPTSSADPREAADFARRFDLAAVSIADLARSGRQILTGPCSAGVSSVNVVADVARPGNTAVRTNPSTSTPMQAYGA